MRQHIACDCGVIISWNMFRVSGMCVNCQAAANVKKYGWNEGILMSSHLVRYGMNEDKVRARVATTS